MAPNETHVDDILDKEFKRTIINMFNEFKQHTIKHE